ncbi:hypothetical protein Tdes44962_MAKER04943 [Teratosphaeria destructans]|uniref:Uncharacterized protein n=1 Tax=Teratosphaeria destructans TaxID=418781 RepID=A0A9W7VZB7_9PEZI|nr:hypothetical protein Tdes44962_MAKER04943 [Teratosphaeria destructans]
MSSTVEVGLLLLCTQPAKMNACLTPTSSSTAHWDGMRSTLAKPVQDLLQSEESVLNRRWEPQHMVLVSRHSDMQDSVLPGEQIAQ